MTNLERIRGMPVEEFINFLKYCNFTGIYPIIEGKRFYTHEALLEWFAKEVAPYPQAYSNYSSDMNFK